MTQWKIILAYDGTPFHGWQVQPDLSTIQGNLADAIYRIARERVLPQGSGRTDAGVHALGQVATFALDAPIPPANLHRALNRCLPASIRVLSAEIVPPDFHARHSAIRKTYEYRIFPIQGFRPPQFRRDGGAEGVSGTRDLICPPTLAPFVWPCPWPLDLTALNRAAQHVLGTHDFTTFAASDPDLAARSTTSCLAPNAPGTGLSGAEEHGRVDFAAPEPHKTPVRSITHSEWHSEYGMLIYRVTATGFLHHMVRNLVGTFVQCGADRLDPDSVPTLIAARNRSVAGPTAPSTGLFLVDVVYPDPEPSIMNPRT